MHFPKPIFHTCITSSVLRVWLQTQPSFKIFGSGVSQPIQKELRSFLGLASFYCKFVRRFATICKSLTELLKKHTLFVWTSEHQQAFETLKHALISAPVLALPDFSSPFCIYTDACHTRVVAILHIYRCRSKGHPLAFLSKALGSWN